MKVINYRAMPLFLICMITAIILAVFVDPLASLCLAIVALGGVILCFFTPKFRRYLLRSIMIAFAIIITVAVTWIDIYFREQFNPVSSEDVVITGKIDGLTNFDENGNLVIGKSIVISNVKYTLTADGVEKKSLSKIVLLGIGEDITNYSIGDIITVQGSLETIKINPTDQSDIRDYREGIGFASMVNKIVEVTPGKPGFFDGIKIKAKALLNKNTSGDSHTGGLIYSMLFGDKTMLEPAVKGDFSLTGLSHLFAVSGLHVGMIALVLIFIMRKLKANKWVQLLVMTIFLGGYSVLCGFSPSVMRASIMILIATLSKALGYRNDSISTLSFSAVIILIFRPFYLFDLSFLMTFFAILGIVMLNKPIYNKLTFAPKFIAEPLAVMLAVNIGLFPILMCYFGSLSLLFAVANLIILPIITLAYPLMFLAVVIGLILPFMGFLITPIALMFTFVRLIVSILAQVPFLTIKIEYSMGFVVVWPIIMLFLSEYILLRAKVKNIIATSLICCYMLTTTITTVSISNTASFSTMYSYDDEKGCYYLEYKESNYLFINSGISADNVDVIKNNLVYQDVRKINAIIVNDATEVEIAALRALDYYFDVDMIMVDNYMETFPTVWDVEYVSELNSPAIAIGYPLRGAIEIEVEGVKICLEGSSQTLSQDTSYDLIYTDLVEAGLNVASKFVVNNRAYAIDKLNKNLVSNDFTFDIKNGKIRLGRK